VFLPDVIVKYDSKLLLMLQFMTLKLDAKLMVYPTVDVKIEEKAILAQDEFFSGMINCLDSDDYVPNMTVKKKPYEDGKATMFHLRLREASNVNKKLTAQCLKKSQYYFGNNPIETKNKKNPVVFHFKAVMTSAITLGELANKLCSLIINMLQRLPPSGEFCSLFRHALVSYTDIVNMQTRSFKIVRKGKRSKVSEKEERLPKRIGVSPLLTTGEQAIIKSLTAPYYGELVPAKPEAFLQLVKKIGFLEVRRRIDLLYRQRWTLQERFASLTTNRLKILRAELKQPGLKKSDVGPEMVLQALANEHTEMTTTFAADSGRLLEGLESIKSIRARLPDMQDDQTVEEHVHSKSYQANLKDIASVRSRIKKEDMKNIPLQDEKTEKDGKSPTAESLLSKEAKFNETLPPNQKIDHEKLSLLEAYRKVASAFIVHMKLKIPLNLDMPEKVSQALIAQAHFSKPSFKFSKDISKDIKVVTMVTAYASVTSFLLKIRQIYSQTWQFNLVCKWFADQLSEYMGAAGKICSDLRTK
jgi:hypothetical protein